MPRSKTFTYAQFKKAVADQLPTPRHDYITYTMFKMGYLEKRKTYTPFLTVIYSLKPDTRLTQEDVDKVVKEMGK
ncbi:MAG: hypothetical protein ACKPE3_01355 [Sphaerospermopsis kisseleviana]